MLEEIGKFSDKRLIEGYKLSSKALQNFVKLKETSVGGFASEDLSREINDARQRMQRYLSEINLRGLDVK